MLTNLLIDNTESWEIPSLVIYTESTWEKRLERAAQKWNISVPILKNDFLAKAGESIVLRNNDKKVTLLGIGDSIAFKVIEDAVRKHVFANRDKVGKSYTLNLKHLGDHLENVISPIISGVLLGHYQLKGIPTNVDIHLILPKENRAKHIILIEDAKKVAEAKLWAMYLVDTPSNIIDPQGFADEIEAKSNEFGFDATTFRSREGLKTLGLHAVLAVNAGSKNNPSFSILEYTPKNPVASIAFVGKGVTFDTGGISMKGSQNMHWMKCDMGGAAAVAGAIAAIAGMRLPIAVTGFIPATDNMVDGASVKPGDVIQSHSGKTIEVIDTDAEGRLCLADGVSFACKMKNFDHIVDIATLTGSSVMTLGYEAGAMLSNNVETAQLLTEASISTDEKIWQLPLWDVYNKGIQSDVADVKNYPGNPAAGAIHAAKFIEAFVQENTKWAHLDIAGVAFAANGYGKDRNATGFGVHLLLEFAKIIANQ
ncbi:leucyl aminopeptidase family protein [Flammeovirga pectinis]|uniref:Leucyl aminopeptidase family protein n=1 Tax=Flammeovirga pectinis TaxID=2494373 RepID=A0A3Q9FNP7_9BACT|nr:leucyl aminopeptidase family protein [Flammeovirga pectinis]AZQ61853.1 leucyl aminopeptidase family protein [Flammeovirga pectinis]